MAILRELEVDLVLSGHRHVPYVWSISGVRVVRSGTVSTLRVRGTMPPSYSLIDLDANEVRIAMRTHGRRADGEEPLARFTRDVASTSHFYPSSNASSGPTPGPPRREIPRTPKARTAISLDS